MGALIVIAFISAFLTKVITNYRVDHEYARQGLDSPRYKVKLAKLAAAGQPASDAEVARPGARGYFRELWNDAWEDATERRREAREAKRTAKDAGVRTSVKEQAANWWQWAVTPIGETRGDAQPAAERPVALDVEPTSEPAAKGPRIACPECGATLTRVDGEWVHLGGSLCEVRMPASLSREQMWPASRPQEADRTPGCSVCGQRAHVEPPCEHWETALQRMRASASAALDRLDPDAGGTATVEANKIADHTNSGGTTMTTAQLDLVDYNQAVAGHEEALTALREQLAQAVEFGLHLTGATVAVEQMDANRGSVATSLAPLAEGMEGTRYDADSVQGSAEATSTLTAGSIAAVQEQIEAATEQNNRWTAELTASIEAIQASLQNIKSRYGEAAAVVQETGIDARALEDH